MVVVFWVAWASGETLATLLFAVIAFFALREFITLSPTRRGDHRSLVLAFFVVLPIQFWLVGTRHFDLFTVIVPVTLKLSDISVLVAVTVHVELPAVPPANPEWLRLSTVFVRSQVTVRS